MFRDTNTVVLVISDDDMIEMVKRKDRGQRPEALLEDVLDEFLHSY